MEMSHEDAVVALDVVHFSMAIGTEGFKLQHFQSLSAVL
jgi:hypothetical protein